MADAAWAIMGISTAMGFLLIGVLQNHLVQKRKLAMREILQKERLMAIEKGTPLPGWCWLAGVLQVEQGSAN